MDIQLDVDAGQTLGDDATQLGSDFAFVPFPRVTLSKTKPLNAGPQEFDWVPRHEESVARIHP